MFTSNLTHHFANRRVRDPYARWCERRTPSVSGGAVYSISGSFSVDEVKWLIFYGENKEKNFDLKTEDKGELDYAITQMFLMMKESSRFDMDRVEKAFWERVTALANYR